MASLQRISIAGYRGFQAEQSLELATIGADQPALTILVGPNGGGKSTVLEAIEFLFRSDKINLPDGDRNAASEYSAHFVGHWDDGFEIELASTPTDLSVVRLVKGKPDRKNVRFVSLRRGFPDQVQAATADWQSHALQLARGSTRGYNPSTLQNRIVNWNSGNQRVLQCLQERFGVRFRAFNSGSIYRVRLDGAEHSPSGLGEGVVYLLNILDALFDAPGNAVVLIEEPEAALHPAWTRELFRLLRESSKHLQIVYATHSPYMLDFPTLVDGAVLARVVREPNGCKIYTLSKVAIQACQGELQNLGNPHVLGSEAREAFFLSDRVILVEGQEDVVCYQRMATAVGAKLNGQFFGWGAGGVGNIKNIARMLQDLGFKRVVGILDANKTHEFQILEKQFPGFHFRAIPTDDVRDKKNADGTVSKKGLCDTAGKIHTEHLQDVKDLMKWISEKFA